MQSPENAISCYLRTQMDVLVVGDFYVTDRTLFQKTLDVCFWHLADIDIVSEHVRYGRRSGHARSAL